MAVQQFRHKTSILISLGRRMVIVKGAWSGEEQRAAGSQVLPDVFDSIEDIFSLFGSIL